jgi:flagellar L-ring protein precursor FlgH
MALALGGCNALTRLSDVGHAPQLAAIENPVKAPQYTPVSMPMPAPQVVERRPNSLWRPGSRAFFKDQRAAQVGDILTVLVEIDDRAELENASTRSRNNTEDASLGSFLGYETNLTDILPEAVNNLDLVDADATTSNDGRGAIDREETIEIEIAAVVIQRLPNGNLVIHGRQEIRVNFEVRELQIAGVIRPEDISAVNTVTADKIAEARIAYGGRGHISDVQQPRYGTQVFDILFPF